MPPLGSLCLAVLPPVGRDTLLLDWSLSPFFVIPLGAMLLWYARQLGRVSRWEAVYFGAGWLMLAVALLSPLCRLSASLAGAHMVQHIILVALAPPLLLLGATGLMGPARGVRRSALGPTAASGLYAAAIWLSHLRPVYEGALTDPVLHIAVVAALFGASLIFWAALLAARANGGAPMMALGALLQTGVLGALLTFSPSPWYPLFGERPLAWGLSPLEDQQLAGLIMWVPMGGIYLLAGLIVLARMLNPGDRSLASRA